MKKTLGRNDFTDKGRYLSFTGKKCEICLEPCMNGFDIAVYNLEQELLEPKYCTNEKGKLGFDPIMTIEQVEKQLAFISKLQEKVNEYYLKYEYEK